MIGIIDYNAGNIKSVERALTAIKAEYIISQNPKDLKDADRIIFPGVGDAAYAMKQLSLTGFDSFIKDWAAGGKPMAGICLGSQIIFDWSEEGDTKCLGLIPGKIIHFSKLWENGENLKVPQIGWNDIQYENGGSKYLAGIKEHTDFYFVHSYVIQPENQHVIKAFTQYGIKVPAVVEKDNITAFQFHPEKSGEPGLAILKNFCFGNAENSIGGTSC